jgi:hypothetical protein
MSNLLYRKFRKYRKYPPGRISGIPGISGSQFQTSLVACAAAIPAKEPTHFEKLGNFRKTFPTTERIQ